jgi:hypothetical protein
MHCSSEYHFDKCHFDECRSDECRGAKEHHHIIMTSFKREKERLKLTKDNIKILSGPTLS